MLRRELVTPIHSYTLRLISVAAGAAAIAAAVTWLAAPRVDRVPSPALASREPPVATVEVVAVEEVPPAPVATIHMTFQAGGALYMKLGPAGASQQHGELALFDRDPAMPDDTTAVVGEVASADLLAEHQAWIGKRAVVDGACTARITGFAVVARLVGDPDYAGIEAERWTARSVFEHGEKMLAARLEDCGALGTFARDAALPPILAPAVIEDETLAQQAREKLLASRPARAAQQRWSEESTGRWYDDQAAVFDTKVVRHPTTGVTWVSAHAMVEYACGGVEISIWGLYRADSDGTLVAAQQRDIDLFALDRLIDLEGDGEFEVIGRQWLRTDVVVERESGEELERLVLPFFGCPC